MKKKINEPMKIDYADSVLSDINIIEDDIIVEIQRYDDKHCEFFFRNYIAISFLGNWDEAVIEDIYYDEHGDLINQSIDNIKKKYKGNDFFGKYIKPIDIDWIQVNIKLINDIELKIACEEVICHVFEET